jgi:predicted patatin/cPLA2 family phospholipase
MPITIEAPRITKDLEAADIQPAVAETERQPESVIKLLLDRVERGYRRGVDDDGHKVGLAFDPGGLAGVVGQAMAQKLEPTGILNCVDAFYGLSAGGLNALYTAAGQLQEGIDCYVDLMPDNGLVSMPTLLPPRLPKMDLEVVRDALYKERRVDVEKISKEKVPVVIGATDLTAPTRRAVIFRSTDNDPNHPELILDQAIAGSHIPKVAGEPVTLGDGRQYTDATMSWSNTVELARADGCTDVLSLANLALDIDKLESDSKSAEFLIGHLGDRYLDNNGPKLPKPYQGPTFKEYLSHPINSVEQRILDSLGGDTGDYWDIKRYTDVLKRKSASQKNFKDRLFIDEGLNVERIYPPDIPELPELLTMDKKRLLTGVKAGSIAVKIALRSLGSKNHEPRGHLPAEEAA